MPSLYETLRADIITAMKARDTETATILRTADAAIQRAAMDANVEIDDELVISTLRKAVKNLNDANRDFAKAGRTDLVEKNEAEAIILAKFLPAQMDAEKLEAVVAEIIASTGAQSRREMGKVMGALKQHPDAGVIDFGAASKIIQSKLN